MREENTEFDILEELAGLTINEQEFANNLGIDPGDLKSERELFKGHYNPFGNVFSGDWANNWTPNYSDRVKK